MDKQRLRHLARLSSYEIHNLKSLIEYTQLNVKASELKEFVEILKKHTNLLLHEIEKINSLKINESVLEKQYCSDVTPIEEFISVVSELTEEFKISVYSIEPKIKFKINKEDILIFLSERKKIGVLFRTSYKETKDIINEIFKNDLTIENFRNKLNKKNILSIKLGGKIE